ncbi:MAG: hypothetical protein H0W64_02300 [Gammaproteobacteria bacterium]|nr:hypothetical protein [Gammaproteobacteria bacterium]
MPYENQGKSYKEKQNRLKGELNTAQRPSKFLSKRSHSTGAISNRIATRSITDPRSAIHEHFQHNPFPKDEVSHTHHPIKFLKPGIKTTLFMSTLFFANLTDTISAASVQTNDDTDKLLSQLNKITFPTHKTCNKDTDGVQARSIKQMDYVVALPGKKPNHCSPKEKTYLDETRVKEREILDEEAKKLMTYYRANCKPEQTGVIAYHYSMMHLKMATTNELMTINVPETNQKVILGMCDEMARIALQKIKKVKAFEGLPMGILSQKIAGEEGHTLAVVLPHSSKDKQINFKKDINIQGLAELYPNAVICDLWNGIIFPLRDAKTLKQFSKYIEHRLEELYGKENYDELPANQKQTMIADIYRYYTHFTSHNLQVLSKPQHACVKEVNEILAEREIRTPGLGRKTEL